VEVQITSDSGAELSGVLSGPASGACALIVHGLFSSKDNPAALQLEKRLNAHSLATLRIDLFGHGQSGGDLADLTIAKGANDVLAAVRYLKSNGYNTVAVVGRSLGGLCAALTAAKESLSCLVLQCPLSEFANRPSLSAEFVSEWERAGIAELTTSEGTKHALKYAFYQTSLDLSAYNAAPLIGCPVLIVHGDADKNVPFEQSVRLCGLLRDCDLRLVHDADHTFGKEGQQDQVLGLIEAFLLRKLR
jgi:uncharacterized protein